MRDQNLRKQEKGMRIFSKISNTNLTSTSKGKKKTMQKQYLKIRAAKLSGLWRYCALNWRSNTHPAGMHWLGETTDTYGQWENPLTATKDMQVTCTGTALTLTTSWHAEMRNSRHYGKRLPMCWKKMMSVLNSIYRKAIFWNKYERVILAK